MGIYHYCITQNSFLPPKRPGIHLLNPPSLPTIPEDPISLLSPEFCLFHDVVQLESFSMQAFALASFSQRYPLRFAPCRVVACSLIFDRCTIFLSLGEANRFGTVPNKKKSKKVKEESRLDNGPSLPVFCGLHSSAPLAVLYSATSKDAIIFLLMQFNNLNMQIPTTLSATIYILSTVSNHSQIAEREDI